MKLAGQEHLFKPYEKSVTFKRNGGHIILTVRAVPESSEFEAQHPRPKPKTKVDRAGNHHKDVDSPEFIAKLEAWFTMRADWIIIRALEATPGLEWERVDINNPDTWKYWRDELREGPHMTEYELNKLSDEVFAAQGLNDEKIESAFNDFLPMLSRVEGQVDSDSNREEQESSVSSEPANASE